MRQLSPLTLAISILTGAVSVARPGVAAQVYDAAPIQARTNAFAVSTLVLMGGELNAALQRRDGDFAAASSDLDLIYAHYGDRAEAMARDLEIETRRAGSVAQDGSLQAQDVEAIERFRQLPRTSLFIAGMNGFATGGPDAAAIALATSFGSELLALADRLRRRDAAPAPLVQAMAPTSDRFSAALSRLLLAQASADEPSQAASIALVTDLIRQSPEAVRRQLAQPAPPRGWALTLLYTDLLSELSQQLTQTEAQLRLASTAEDHAAVVSERGPQLRAVAERAFRVAAALSEVSPETLPRGAADLQREEISRIVDLTLSARQAH